MFASSNARIGCMICRARPIRQFANRLLPDGLCRHSRSVKNARHRLRILQKTLTSPPPKQQTRCGKDEIERPNPRRVDLRPGQSPPSHQRTLKIEAGPNHRARLSQYGRALHVAGCDVLLSSRNIESDCETGTKPSTSGSVFSSRHNQDRRCS